MSFKRATSDDITVGKILYIKDRGEFYPYTVVEDGNKDSKDKIQKLVAFFHLTYGELYVRKRYHCPNCKGYTYDVDYCDNPCCPNMPCCGKPRELCSCGYESFTVPKTLSPYYKEGIRIPRKLKKMVKHHAGIHWSGFTNGQRLWYYMEKVNPEYKSFLISKICHS